MKYIDIMLPYGIYPSEIFSYALDFNEKLHEYLEENNIHIDLPDTIQVNENDFWDDVLKIYMNQFNEYLTSFNSCLRILSGIIDEKMIIFKIAYDETKLLDEIGNLIIDSFNLIDALDEIQEMGSSYKNTERVIALILSDYSFQDDFMLELEDEITQLYIGNYVQ